MQCLLQVVSAGLGNRSLKDHQKLGYRKRIEADLAWPGVLIPAQRVRFQETLVVGLNVQRVRPVQSRSIAVTHMGLDRAQATV